MRRHLSTSACRFRNELLHQPDAQTRTLLHKYSSQNTKAVTYHDLMKYGRPPLSEATLLQSGEHTRQQLLAGLARRVSAHLSLPFLPATNPSLHSIYRLYYSAFTSMASIPKIETLEENVLLCQAIEKMVDEHRDNIPVLAKGFQQARKYLPDNVITTFLDRAIRNRITLRLLAEQHLSLSHASSDAAAVEPDRIGVLDLKLSPRRMINACATYVSELCEATYGVSPRWRIEGSGAESTVGAIGVHLEYIMTELLKNAFRATVEHHSAAPAEPDPGVFRFEDTPHAHMSRDDFPEVVVTIGTVPGVLTIRISDRGGGIPEDNLKNVFSYAFTTVPEMSNPDSDPDSPDAELYGGASGVGYLGGAGGGPPGGESTLKTGLGTLAGLGFGLPLSRLYAAYFGGSLDLVSMHGWGTDVFVVLRCATMHP